MVHKDWVSLKVLRDTSLLALGFADGHVMPFRSGRGGGNEVNTIVS